MERIQCKYADRVLIPSNGTPKSEEVVTSDGVRCRMKFLATWNNEGDRYEKEFEGICQQKYKASFRAIRSIWIARLGHVDNYWHLINLIKL